MNSPQLAAAPDLTTIVTANHAVIFAELGSEVSLLNTRTGVYYTLNAVGTSIWQQIQQPSTLSAIKQRLLDEYEVHPARCEDDLHRIVEELLVHGLASVSPS